MESLRTIRALLITGLLWAGAHVTPAAAAAPTEQQVKAVFLFNFSNFVEWPADAFTSSTEPFVIGLLGGEALAVHLEEAIRGESVDGRPLLLRRFNSVEELGASHILFIDRLHDARLEQVLDAVRGRRTLTVTDFDGAARRGAMIQLYNESNRIRMEINVEEARRAGLSISSNLLRPARIVRTEAQVTP